MAIRADFLRGKSEDCLTLNIWSSAKETNEPKAVMFWVHGGSNAWGGTADAAYNGQNFVEAHPDVVLVTANYRLGMMSWPDFTEVPGGEGYTDINLGLRDLICALQWVQATGCKNMDELLALNEEDILKYDTEAKIGLASCGTHDKGDKGTGHLSYSGLPSARPYIVREYDK